MFFLRAVTSGPWRSVDITEPKNGDKVGERVLVMAKEFGKWNVDNTGVQVVPGLVVSFSQYVDAEWFLNQDRAQWITAEPGMAFAFASEGDAQFYVRKRLGEQISQAEANEIWVAQARAAGYDPTDETGEGENEGEDIMQKTTGIENKGMKGAAETKTAPKADPKPAPKPAAKSGGKKGK